MLTNYCCKRCHLRDAHMLLEWPSAGLTFSFNYQHFPATITPHVTEWGIKMPGTSTQKG